MALFQWIAVSKHQDLLRNFVGAVEQLGLEIDPEFSSSVSIYAREQASTRTPANARVTVIISATNGSKDEFQIEVRSSEPMLKRGTRCEQIATDLKAILLSKA
ncbi:hypothetical protein KBY65_10895 [Cyanobium sp. Alchichica 3B3-8F6]|uniref:hypothetical protein n=1 Tax=Synechococcales TaxID=1890424 RepID=UPI000B9910DE|nr:MULTISPECIES: hypothetical protein [Synechococcales]MCP9882977.1 hypothetical protein [Cyanobium sp. Alchichica 3B3-8F6]MCP9942147.1 hypothetical protein [Cyanobium sp. ATX 6E8]